METKTVTRENARIESTMLGIEDHGILTFMVHLKMGASGVGFGGFALDGFDKTLDRRIGGAFGMEAVRRVLEVVGVEKWEALPGQHVRVEHEGWGGGAVRLGNIIEDKWLDLKELSAWFKKYHAAEARP